jgi:ubiquinone/menaquinone biosynthesis C-methylase UbiE
VTDVWSKRADAFRESATHREGPDLDRLVEWAEGETALDVATGGGHVARRLRDAGLSVVSCDPAPGMQPDVICRAEDLPFADASFDTVVCRIAAHHFEDVPASVREMARVARLVVLVEDNLFVDEESEEADRARDPSHVRNHSEEEWKQLFADAGLEIEQAWVYVKHVPVQPWLDRVECRGAEAQRVRELLADRIDAEDRLEIPSLLVKGRKR